MKSKLRSLPFSASAWAALMLAIIVGFAVHFFLTRREEALARFSEHQVAEAQLLALEIRANLETAARIALHVASLPSVQRGDAAQIHADLHAYFKPETDHPMFSVYDSKGMVVYSTDAGTLGQDHSQADFVQWAKQNRDSQELFVSTALQHQPISAGQAPETRFLLATPLYEGATDPSRPLPGTQRTGVLVMGVDVQQSVRRHLSVFRPGMHPQRIWIMDRDGTLLLQSSKPEMVQHNTRQKNAQCAQCHASFAFAERVLAAKQGTTEYQLKGNLRKLAAFTRMEFANASWAVVVNSPQNEVTAFVQRGFMQMALFVALVLVAVGLVSAVAIRNYRLKMSAQAEAKLWRDKSELEGRTREAEGRYRTLFEQSPDGVLMIEPETGQYVEFNDKAHEQLGYTRDEFSRLRIADHAAPVAAAECATHMARALSQGKDEFETKFRAKDGRIRDFAVVMQPLDLHASRVVLAVYRDTTERHQTNEALRQSEGRFRNLLQDIPSVAIQGYRPDGQIQYWNRASERLYGYTAQEAIGRNLLDLVIPPEMTEDVKRAIRQMAETGKPIPASELCLRRKDGSRVSVYSSHAIVPSAEGIPDLFCVDIDLTELKRAEATLRESEEKFRTIMEQLAEAVFVTDSQGVATYLSPAAQSLFGLPLEQMIGLHFQGFLAEEDIEKSMSGFAATVMRGEHVQWHVTDLPPLLKRIMKLLHLSPTLYTRLTNAAA